MIASFRFALRGLRRSPGFSLAAITMLAFGIGVNSAIFTLVNQVLLNPPGISEPDRVLGLEAKYDKLNLKNIPISPPDFNDIRKHTELFEKTSIVGQGDFNYTGENITAEYLQGAPVSAEFFDVFGTKPALGRSFAPEEDQPGANYVVVLAYTTWKRLFNGDSSIIGKSIQLNQKSYKVIGVAAQDFRWPSRADLWVPLGLPPEKYGESNRFNENYFGFARLKAGVSFRQADAYLGVLSNEFKHSGTPGGDYARNGGWGMFAVPITDFLAGNTKTPILILFGAVVLVLLIGSSNIAGLMLARSIARNKEIAIRAALGAGRWKLLQPTIAESFALALSGAVGGMAVSYTATRLLLLIAPEDMVKNLNLRMDVRVLLFIGAVTLLVGCMLAAIQAAQVSRNAPYSVLKDSGRSASAGPGRYKLRAVLVTGETALAMVLLTCAGLFLRSLAHLQDVNPGFDTSNVWAANLSLSQTEYEKPEAKIAFYRTARERLSSMPGISAAAFSSLLPFSGVERTGSFNLVGRPLRPGDPEPNARLRYVTPEYFQTLGISLKAGRVFSPQDRMESEPVVVVDESLVKQFWRKESPIGRQIVRNKQAPATIIGIVGRIKHSDLGNDDSRGTIYFSLFQQPSLYSSIVVKSRTAGMDMTGQVRQAISLVDPSEALYDIRPMQTMVFESLATRRLITKLLEFFSMAALLMAALGMYGVIAYSVAQRTQEIGIRIALGAQKLSVLRLVLGHSVKLTGLGVIIGLAGAIMATRSLQSQWFGLNAADPATFAAVGFLMIATALLASYMPARRALRVNPVDALHSE
jgi:putative ABC transport system permease protein